jgi:hypothetical protein
VELAVVLERVDRDRVRPAAAASADGSGWTAVLAIRAIMPGFRYSAIGSRLPGALAQLRLFRLDAGAPAGANPHGC